MLRRQSGAEQKALVPFTGSVQALGFGQQVVLFVWGSHGVWARALGGER